MFSNLPKFPLKSCNSLADPTILKSILVQIDKIYFDSISLSNSSDRSEIIIDLTDIKGKIIDYLKSGNIPLNDKFNSELETIKIGAMARKDQKEIEKVMNMIILMVMYFNDELLSKLDKTSNDLLDLCLEISDTYVANEEGERESIRESIHQRITISQDTNNIYKEETNEDKNNNDDLDNKDNEAYIRALNDNIDTLQQKLNEYIDIEDKLKNMEIENDNLKKQIKNLEQNEKDYEFKYTVLTKENEGNKTKLLNIMKENTKVLIYKNQIEELTLKLKEKENENKNIKKGYNINEEKYLNEIEKLKSRIDIIKEKEINNNEYKKNYEKLDSKYQILVDKCNRLNTIEKDYADLKKYVESNNINNGAPLTTSEKEKLNNYISELKEKNLLLQQKDYKIEELNSIINKLKEEQKYINKTEDVKHIKQNNKKTNKNVPDLYFSNRYEFDTDDKYFSNCKADNEELIEELNEKIKDLQHEIITVKEDNKTLIAKCKKENEDLQNKLNSEFELISSAIYTLGSSFWNMKFNYEQKLNKNISWLVRERQKELNGDC